MEKKYEIVKEVMSLFEQKEHYRIRALRDIPRWRVFAGDLGGWIEKEENLDQEGDCWIAGEAIVSGDARVMDNAIVCEQAIVDKRALIGGNAKVSGRARCSDKAKVLDLAVVRGNPFIGGTAIVGGPAIVEDEAIIDGTVRVYGTVRQGARVSGWAVIHEKGVVSQQMLITGDTVVKKDLTIDLVESLRAQCGIIPIDDYIIAYKQVHPDLSSDHDPNFIYHVGSWAVCSDWDDDRIACSSGLHFGPANYWDRQMYNDIDVVFLVAKIMLEDIITVQHGKIRCTKAFILDSYTP